MKDLIKNLEYFYTVFIHDMSFFGSFVFMFFVFVFHIIFKQYDFAVRFLYAVLVFTTLEVLIKKIYKHKRPDFKVSKINSSFEKFEEQTSFPSGHSGKAAMTTVLINQQYMMPYLTLLFVCTTILVGVSRRQLKRHYWTDIVAGYVLGIIVGLMFL